MASGTGISALGAPLPNDSGASLLKSAYPIDHPTGMGGETFKYESRGGYIPDTSKYSSKRSMKPHHHNKRKQHKGGRAKKSKKSRKSRKNRTRRSYH